MVNNGVENIFVKLSFTDQMQLNKYINRKINEALMQKQEEINKEVREREKLLEELNKKTWDKIEAFLHQSMRENRVSEERTKRIEKRVLELSIESDEELLIKKGE